jgi:hypothetical protein
VTLWQHTHHPSTVNVMIAPACVMTYESECQYAVFTQTLRMVMSCCS